MEQAQEAIINVATKTAIIQVKLAYPIYWHQLIQLRQWMAQGVLVALPAASRQQASDTKPELAGLLDLTSSLSVGLDNEIGNE